MGYGLLYSQYQPIEVKVFDKVHDRFLCIDNTVYHIGASLKDLGKKWLGYTPAVPALGIEQTLRDLPSALTFEPVAFTKMEMPMEELIGKM